MVAGVVSVSGLSPVAALVPTEPAEPLAVGVDDRPCVEHDVSDAPSLRYFCLTTRTYPPGAPSRRRCSARPSRISRRDLLSEPRRDCAGELWQPRNADPLEPTPVAASMVSRCGTAYGWERVMVVALFPARAVRPERWTYCGISRWICVGERQRSDVPNLGPSGRNRSINGSENGSVFPVPSPTCRRCPGSKTEDCTRHGSGRSP